MFDRSKKYGILGMARSGIAAAFKIKELGGKAFISDSQPMEAINGAEELLANFECEFGGHTERLLECDEWIVSPGIPLNIPIITEGIKIGIPMISEIEFGYRIKATDSRIIAVTGSNGKSTTASFIYHILKNMGFNTILAGNIGDAFCGYPIHKPGLDFIVLEISSFQLDLIKSFKPDVAVLLNITPDHLYRYQSFEHYASSKIQMFSNQSEQDYAILNFDDPQIRMREQRIHSKKLYFTNSHQDQAPDAFANESFLHFDNEEKLSIYELSIKGPHNLHNAMASILAANALIQDMPAVLKATHGFKPLKHRLEFVRTINGVSFYNDSKATNMDSVHYALLSFDRPIRIIMGGSDKGEDYNIVAPLLKEKALMTYITGATSDKMRQAWLGKLPLICIDDFEETIRRAFDNSMAGDVIVLSPGCASFDRFRNFEHRGNRFIEIVNQIAEENEKK